MSQHLHIVVTTLSAGLSLRSRAINPLNDQLPPCGDRSVMPCITHRQLSGLRLLVCLSPEVPPARLSFRLAQHDFPFGCPRMAFLSVVPGRLPFRLSQCGFTFVCDCRTLPENNGMARWDPEAKQWTFPAAAMKAMEAALKERLPELHLLMPPKFTVAMMANPLTGAGRHHLPFELIELVSFHMDVVVANLLTGAGRHHLPFQSIEVWSFHVDVSSSQDRCNEFSDVLTLFHVVPVPSKERYPAAIAHRAWDCVLCQTSSGLQYCWQ